MSDLIPGRCVYINGCQADYLAGTLTELERTAKNAFTSYITENDPEMGRILDENQEYVSARANEVYYEFIDAVCPLCPYRDLLDM